MEKQFQSKSVPNGTRTIWRYLSALILLFSLSIGQMWAAAELTLSTTASGAAFGDWNKSYTNVVVTTVGPSAFGSKKACGVSSNVATYSLSSADSHYLEISLTSAAASSYTLDKVVLRVAGNSSGTTDYTAPLFYSNEATFDDHKVEGVMDIHYTGYDQSCDDNEYSFPVGTKSCRLYRRAKWTAPAGETKGIVGTGSNYSCSNQTMHITYMEVYLKSSCTKPGTPGTPSVSSKTHNSANLTWTAASNSDGYKISIVKKLDASVIVDWTDCATNSYAASGLSPETTYTFKVKAKGATGFCDLGDESSADFATEVDPSATTYKVTLIPAGGAISDATGWTLNAGNYEKEVSSGSELALPTFTKANRTFKTWRKAGPTDVTSPITVTADVTLTAVWNATVENVIYSWEGAEGGATEVGGTAHSSTDGGSTFDDAQINVSQSGYYCIQLNGGNGYADKIVEITLSGEEKVKAGDKIRYTGFYNNSGTKNAAPKMRASDGTAIFSGSNLPNITTSEPRTDTHVVPSGINTATVQLTRHQTQSSSFLTKLQIVREVQVEEGDLLTVTFNTNGGSSIAPVMVASGQTVAKPADPTKEHNRFNEWQLSGSAYNFSTPVTSSITLDATWTPLYTVTYAANGGSGTMTDANEYAAGDEVTLLENTFEAPDVTKIWDSWAVTDALDNPVSVSAGKFAMPSSNATVTAQWTTISDFDVMFFQGFGEVDVQIGETQTISTGNYATAPAEDPERAGYRFLGWSYDATAEHIVNVSEYAITAATNFTAMWIQQFSVTFDGAGEVLVDNGAMVASPNSPVTAGKVFQGWYNGESKYDFSAAVTENLALESKWMDADPNHFFYFYKDAFHYDGVSYKRPDGIVDAGAGGSNIAITNPYTLFSGEGGITSIVANNAIYDSKSNWVNAYLKLNTEATSNLVFTIKSGFSAVLYMKMGGYSADPTVTLVDAGNNPVAMTGTISGRASDENGFAQVSFNLVAGTYTLTTTVKTLYISDIELITTVIPAHTVTYKAGEGTGDDVVDADATQVADVPGSFTAPEGKIFHGWKDGDNNDVAVGAIVEADMTLTAQWIGHYAVTFNLQGHGASIVAQDIVHGSKAVKPADPVAIGWEFGGWFTEAACENEFDFNTAITAATPLFAKWTEFDGCTLLYPATSGSALSVGDNVDVQTGSKGGSIAIVGMKEATSIAYSANGLALTGGGADVISVTLGNDMDIDTRISVTLVSLGTGSRGLNLLTATGAKVKGGTMLGWAEATAGAEETFSYTVEAADGLEGTNIFRLQRNNSVALKCVKVESCGAAIVYHNVTSAVVPAGKGTVALGAGSVRVGHTTTAEFSDIDPLYEFVNWTVSGEGASIEDASANPATITMGTEDAVVTLNLQLIPVKFTVNYYDGETPMGSELVAVNEHPTASEIDTDKRHFTFQGWAETDGGSVVDLNTITRTEATTVNLYAVYAPVVCPVSGYLFSMEFDETKTPESTVKAPRNGGVVELADYAIISGGEARIINNETGSDKDAITTSGQFKLTANGEFMKIELGCALQEGDIIRIPDNNQKLYISTSTSATGTYQEFASSSVHEFSVSDAWNNIDDIYVLYHGSALTFTKVYVYRPALLTVSFNMKGHGSPIADIENVLEGSKITAPTAPTDEDYSFAGWYKETTLENVWNFAEDVVTANTTLFAKWIDKSDATLKSLKYGSDEISLEDGVYEYEIALPAAVASVPALTAVTSNPSANAEITDAAAFDEDGKATSTVEVTPQKEGAAHLTYTVNFTKLAELPQVDVTVSTLWDFSLAGTTSLINQTDVVLANLPGINNDENFNAQALEGSFNKLQGDGHSYQGSKLMFTVAEEGLLTIEFSGTNNHARHLQVCTGDGEIEIADWDYNSSSTHQTKSIEIPAGKITLKAFEGESANNARIYKMEYLSLAERRSESWIKPGELGTVCLKDAAKVDGATIYELQGPDEYGKLVFDEITSGELVAGRPYLFEATATGKISFYKQVNAAHTEDAGVLNGMHGTFADIEFTPSDENIYYFSGNAIWSMAKRTTNATVYAYRCYLDMDEFKSLPSPSSTPAPGRRRMTLNVNGPKVPTAIDEVLGDETQAVKLMIDGQLFILRNGKMYDSTGKVVK